MPPRPALQAAPRPCAGPAGAAPHSAIRSASGRRPPLSSADRLRRCSDRLDRLIADVEAGHAGSHREVERRIGEAEAIADGLRAVFRAPSRTGPAAEHPRHPPLFINGGEAVW